MVTSEIKRTSACECCSANLVCMLADRLYWVEPSDSCLSPIPAGYWCAYFAGWHRPLVIPSKCPYIVQRTKRRFGI